MVYTNQDQDEIFMRVIGNLITAPSVHDDRDEGKVCICKIASNARARRYDETTGEPIPETYRTRNRTVIQLRIVGEDEARAFARSYRVGDRFCVEGTVITRPVQKMCYSKKAQEWIPCIVDIDGDIVPIYKDRLQMTVSLAIPIAMDNQHTNTNSSATCTA